MENVHHPLVSSTGTNSAIILFAVVLVSAVLVAVGWCGGQGARVGGGWVGREPGLVVCGWPGSPVWWSVGGHGARVVGAWVGTEPGLVHGWAEPGLVSGHHGNKTISSPLQHLCNNTIGTGRSSCGAVLAVQKFFYGPRFHRL